MQQPVELSDTDDADWEPPKTQPAATQQQQQQQQPTAGGGADAGAGVQPQPGDDPNRVYSSASVFAVRRGASRFGAGRRGRASAGWSGAR